MIGLLSKIFIKNSQDTNNPEVRQKYGMLCGAIGIFLNILLFAGKFFAGLISNSVSITADAFNNLSDAGSSVVTLIGFKLAGQEPDLNHPFGHGRIEYISGLVVSMAILLMGYELGKTSFDKIINPQPVEFSTITAVILIISVLIKLYMNRYNKSVADKIDSAAMRATAADSLSDSVATSVVLIASVIGKFTNFAIDGWCGALVSLFILRAGYMAAKDTISPLLGQRPDAELVGRIYEIVMEYPEVLGLHDLIVHDYGPGRIMVTLHAEVNAQANLLYTHDIIDNIENRLKKEIGCEATIHMDPIAQDNENVQKLNYQIKEKIAETLGKDVSIHDFRIVEGHTHTNVIFDVVIPYKFDLSLQEVEEKVENIVYQIEDGYYRPVIKVEHAYV